jgi:hypothetical protein
MRIREVIAISVADRLAGCALVQDVPHAFLDFTHRVLALEDEHHHARLCAGAFRRKIRRHVVPDQLLRGAVRRVVIRHEAGGVLSREFHAGREHARRHKIEAGARDEARENTSTARFANRVGRQEHVGKFVGHGCQKTRVAR